MCVHLWAKLGRGTNPRPKYSLKKHSYYKQELFSDCGELFAEISGWTLQRKVRNWEEKKQSGLVKLETLTGERFLGQDITLIQYSSRYTESKKWFKGKRGQTKGGQQVL